MSGNRKKIVSSMALVSLAWASVGALAGDPQTLEMPAEDRALLDEYLGRGVVGKAVPAKPIGDPIDYVQFATDGTYAVKITSGEEKGHTIDHSVRKMHEDSEGVDWEIRAGKSDIIVLRYDKHGNIVFVHHAEPGEGDAIYSPSPPLLKKGMKPGSTDHGDFAVTIRSTEDPKKIKHTGNLHLKLSYLGMFELNLPFGKHNAVLIKSAYKGKIGPAKVDDTQYRFFVENVGMVAMVERKDISAFVVYSEHVKVGKLLVKGK